MKAWSLQWTLLTALASIVYSLNEFHIDKSKDLFTGFGVGFKYPSELMVISKKLIKRRGMLTSNYKLESQNEYDLVITLKVQGQFRGLKDGLVVSISPDDTYTKITEYRASNAKDMGYVNKLTGLIMALRLSTVNSTNATHVGYNLYTRYFPNMVKVKDGNLHKTLNPKAKVFTKEIFIDKEEGKLDLNIRWKNGTVKLLVKPFPYDKPMEIYSASNSINLKSFFMTFSAASTESYVGVKVPNIYFKSDLQNSDVVYFENHDFSERTDVFNYIHYMHDILQEQQDNEEKDINISKISSEDIISTMMGYQTKSIDHLRPVNTILAASEQEISSTFTYLDNYRNVTAGYYVDIVKKVQNMLKASNSQLSTMTKDIDGMNKQLSNNKFIKAASNAEKKLNKVKSTLMEFDSKLNHAVREIETLKTHVEAGSHFIHMYEDLLDSLPNSVRQELEQSTQAKTSALAIIGKAISYLIVLTAIIGLLAICFSLSGKSKSGGQL